MMKQLILTAYLFLSNNANHLNTVEAFGTPPPSSLVVGRGSSYFEASSRSIRVTKIHAEEGGAEAEDVTPVDDYPLLPTEGSDSETNDIIINGNNRDDNTAQKQKEATATNLKLQLYQLAASYDRGFGATPKARAQGDDIIQQLAMINPTEYAARGIDGDYNTEAEVPLKAIWRMVWTTAFDVVSLGASPFAAPSAIYQDISNPPIATNIIDFIPRAQTFFPASISPPSLLRAEVATRASSRKGMSNRVGLSFEGIKLQPIELLGQKVDNLPPLNVDLTWPRNLVEQVAEFVPGLESLGLTSITGGGGDGEDVDAPGYFDVEYLDGELLIIRQQVPGGVFAL
eukprot:CAMPEP_0201995888 /NCGR_PEP_ID=MMETSP0905-20130828/3153_1 /ASSEMBLY_ACC=CAM_ASM_000554 /TAXON_ID=420261 /ORGANISM="Thalassiosira antarctica, Strain CCMP982" /LENGTH=341 /DNA_ID=CAMNT_0048551053 /DNA_START=25 /DNA_END=1047 /DNA_ORIENTATION=-